MKAQHKLLVSGLALLVIAAGSFMAGQHSNAGITGSIVSDSSSPEPKTVVMEVSKIDVSDGSSVSCSNANEGYTYFDSKQSRLCVCSGGSFHCFGQQQVQAVQPKPALGSSKSVFVSSEKFAGGIGFEGADSACNSLASKAGLLGEWKAWLSGSTENAIDRIGCAQQDNSFARLDGQPVASSCSDLADGLLLNPIIIDENGNLVQAGDNAWTGTAFNGKYINGASTSASCKDWTLSEYPGPATGPFGIYGKVGELTKLRGMWTNTGASVCDKEFHIYCFQQ